MKQSIAIVGGLALVLSGACGTPETETKETVSALRGVRAVRVLSRNIYVGADVDAVSAALATPDPNDELPALLAAVQTFYATDFSVRAQQLAAEIERTRPDVIGLQEVFFVDIDLSAFGLPPVSIDFLPVLQNELSSLGLSYTVAKRVNTTDVRLPGVRLLDSDALLVEAGVTLHESSGQLFAANVGDPGIGIEVVRGWTAAHVTVRGVEMQVINTHLESGDDPLSAGLRALQAQEIVALARTDMPVIVLGDLNDEEGSSMYAVFAAAGFADVWRRFRPFAPGLTCCHEADLANDVVALENRIDYVLARGFERPSGRMLGWVRRVGFLPWERVQGPSSMLWASDHLGVAATIIAAGPRR